MRGRRLVPTLAMLALAGAVSASDGVAPVITMAVDDALLAPLAVPENTSDPAAALMVDSFISELYTYNLSTTPNWQAFPSATTGFSARGVAVVSADSYDKGVWQYSSGTTGSTWTTINQSGLPLSDSNALLLSDIVPSYGAQFRFVPFDHVPGAATADFQAHLVFRAWDGSDNNADQSLVSTANGDPFAPQPFGGSPTAYSAETRTLTVQVTHTDQAPVVEIPNVSSPGTWVTDTYTGTTPDPISVTVEVGGTITLPIQGADPELDAITWSVVSLSPGMGTFTTSATGDQPGLTYTALAATGSDTLQVTLDDGNGGTTTVGVNVTIVNGVAPTIDPVPTSITVHAGQSLPLNIVAHDADGNALTWSISSLAYSSLSGVSINTVTLGTTDSTWSANLHGDAIGSDTLIATVDDGLGLTAQVSIPITIDANPDVAPTLGSSIGTLALKGQPYEALVTVVDPDTPAANLTVTVNSLPTWLTYTPITNHSGRLHGTPPLATATGSAAIDITLSDGSLSTPVTPSIWVDVTADYPITLNLPPVSTANAPFYTAIAPGGLSGFQAIDSLYAGLFPGQARGVWWRSGFNDLPTLPPEPVTAGIFLATTVDVATPSFSASPQPAPFAIALSTGAPTVAKWHFLGVPPIATNPDGIAIATTHNWSDFALQTADGVPVTDPTTVLNVLGDGNALESQFDQTRPYTFDQSVLGYYGRTATLATGIAYWIPNFDGTTAYRLVRTDGSDSSSFGNILSTLTPGLGALTRTAAATSLPRSGPPAPPGGHASPTAAAGDGSGCGAGGLAGMILAAMAMLGLRRGRRS